MNKRQYPFFVVCFAAIVAIVMLFSPSFSLPSLPSAGRAMDMPVSDGSITTLTDKIVDLDDQIDTASPIGKFFLNHGREDELLATSEERASMLVQLVQDDPEAAVDAATLADKRDAFPEEVKPYIEKSFEYEGTLQVIGPDENLSDENLSKIIPGMITVGNTPTPVYAEDLPREDTSYDVRLTGVALNGLVAAKRSSIFTTQNLRPARPVPEDYKVLLIYVKYPSSNIPFDDDELSWRVFEGPVQDTIAASSYGKTHLSGDFVTLEREESACVDFAEFDVIREWLNAQDISKYDSIVLLDGRECGHDGWGYVGPAKGMATKITATTRTLSNSYLQPPTPRQKGSWTRFDNVIVHELGHNFGFWHANSLKCPPDDQDVFSIPPCTFQEYGDPYDIMGTGSIEFQAAYRARAGWLPQESITVASGDGTYDLSSADAPSGQRLLVVPSTNTGLGYEPLYVEYYENPLYYNTPKRPGILIRVENALGQSYNAPQKSVTLVPSQDNFLFHEGESYVDKLRDFKITLVSASSDSYAKVLVEYGLNKSDEVAAKFFPMDIVDLTYSRRPSVGENDVLTASGTLQWYSSLALPCTLYWNNNSESDTVPSIGTYHFSTDLPQRYSIKCSGGDLMARSSVDVPLPAPNDSIIHNPRFDLSGVELNLWWEVTSPTRCNFTRDDMEVFVDTDGTVGSSFIGFPIVMGGSYTNAIKLFAAGDNFSLSCNGLDGGTSNVTVTVPPITKIMLSRVPSSSSSIGWSVYSTVPDISCVASGNWSGEKDIGGQETVNDTPDAVYTLTCSSPSMNVSTTKSITLSEPQIINYFFPSLNQAPSSFGLQWFAEADSCSASGAWSGDKPVSGYEEIDAESYRSYSLTCTLGDKSETLSVVVGPVQGQ